jgi:nitroreductase
VGPGANELLAFLRAPRATRTFAPRAVAAADVEAIVATARWAGSARNRQPWRFVLVTDEPTRERLSRLGAYAGHLAGAPAVLVLLSRDGDGLIDTEFDLGRVAQAVTLAAHALGLGSCVATLYPDENVAAAARLVDARVGWRPRLAISLGYPGEPAGGGRPAIPRGRLSVDELLLP